MFRSTIEGQIENLREALDFESSHFVEEPKMVLSELEQSQIVGYYARPIVFDKDDGCGGSFVYVYYDILIVLPESYFVDPVIMNVYSFFKGGEITSVETDINKIYRGIYASDIQSDAKLILFECRQAFRIEKISCCVKMDEQC